MTTIDNPPAEGDQQNPTDPPAEDEGKKARSREGNAEAAARRVQQRAAETERDALKEKVTDLQRNIIESRLANDADLPLLHRSADLFEVVGKTVADLLDDDGNVSDEKLRDALDEVKTERPYLISERPVLVDPLYASLQRQAVPAPVAPATDTGAAWQKALRTQ